MSDLSREAIEQMDEAALRQALLDAVDNPIIQRLRKEVKDSSRSVKEAEQAGRRAAQFEFTLRELGLDSANQKVVELVKAELEDQDITLESVEQAFNELGVTGSREPVVKAVEEPATPAEESPVAQQMAEVAGLSAKVNAQAKGGPTPIADRIRNARSQEDLIEAAREGGFLADSYGAG